MNVTHGTPYDNGHKLSFEGMDEPHNITFANGFELNFVILDEAKSLSTDKIFLDTDLE